MTATIYHTNTARGMYSVKLKNGSFTVFELVDPIELRRNTTVNGEFEELGDREMYCEADDKLHIHIDTYGLDEVVAFKKTFLIV
jgi:hypothetical protein